MFYTPNYVLDSTLWASWKAWVRHPTKAGVAAEIAMELSDCGTVSHAQRYGAAPVVNTIKEGIARSAWYPRFEFDTASHTFAFLVGAGNVQVVANKLAYILDAGKYAQWTAPAWAAGCNKIVVTLNSNASGGVGTVRVSNNGGASWTDTDVDTSGSAGFTTQTITLATPLASGSLVKYVPKTGGAYLSGFYAYATTGTAPDGDVDLWVDSGVDIHHSGSSVEFIVAICEHSTGVYHYVGGFSHQCNNAGKHGGIAFAHETLIGSPSQTFKKNGLSLEESYAGATVQARGGVLRGIVTITRTAKIVDVRTVDLANLTSVYTFAPYSYGCASFGKALIDLDCTEMYGAMMAAKHTIPQVEWLPSLEANLSSQNVIDSYNNRVRAMPTPMGNAVVCTLNWATHPTRNNRSYFVNNAYNKAYWNLKLPANHDAAADILIGEDWGAAWTWQLEDGYSLVARGMPVS